MTKIKVKKYKLPKAFAKKWLKALRSGKYKQTSNTLKGIIDNDEGLKPIYGYCCLGVACEINKISLPMDEATSECPFGLINSGVSNGKRLKGVSVIPKQLRANRLVDGTLVGDLVTLNDNEGESFIGIADWIEKNVEFY